MMNAMKIGVKPKGTTEATNRERYKQQYTRFIENEFTYNTHVLLKQICQNGQKQPYMYGIPLYKIMLQVVKIMMMNELQTLFLGSTLQEMKWKITDTCLNDYVNDAEDITPHLPKDTEARKVQFSLLLISYIVKIYLNEDNAIIDFKIRDIIKSGFDRMYQTWVGRVSSNFRFNPKSMNRIFKQYDIRKQEKQVEIIDYNKLVAEFFKQNDGNTFNAEAIDLRYEEEHYPRYQSRPMQHQNQNQLYLSNRNSIRNPSRRNDIEEVPMQEEEEMPPQISDRRYSNRLTHKISEIGFVRRQSGNQFFAPETNRKGIFAPDILRNSSSRADDSR